MCDTCNSSEIAEELKFVICDQAKSSKYLGGRWETTTWRKNFLPKSLAVCSKCIGSRFHAMRKRNWIGLSITVPLFSASLIWFLLTPPGDARGFPGALMIILGLLIIRFMFGSFTKVELHSLFAKEFSKVAVDNGRNAWMTIENYQKLQKTQLSDKH